MSAYAVTIHWQLCGWQYIKIWQYISWKKSIFFPKNIVKFLISLCNIAFLFRWKKGYQMNKSWYVSALLYTFIKYIFNKWCWYIAVLVMALAKDNNCTSWIVQNDTKSTQTNIRIFFDPIIRLHWTTIEFKFIFHRMT